MGAVVLLAGVGGSPGRDVTRQPVTQPVTVTAALDAAAASVDTARKELLDAVGLVVVAAKTLDAADEACGTGRARIGGHRPRRRRSAAGLRGVRCRPAALRRLDEEGRRARSRGSCP